MKFKTYAKLGELVELYSGLQTSYTRERIAVTSQILTRKDKACLDVLGLVHIKIGGGGCTHYISTTVAARRTPSLYSK